MHWGRFDLVGVLREGTSTITITITNNIIVTTQYQTLVKLLETSIKRTIKAVRQ